MPYRVQLGRRYPDFTRELTKGIGRAVRVDAATKGALEDMTAIHEVALSRVAITSLRSGLSLQPLNSATRRTRSVLVGFSVMPARVCDSDPRIVSARPSRSISAHRKASSSPRRAPQPSARRMNGPQRVSSPALIIIFASSTESATAVPRGTRGVSTAIATFRATSSWRRAHASAPRRKE